MATQKFKNKRDLINFLEKTDALEAFNHEVVKTSTSSTKKSTLNKFVAEASAYIDDQRQVLLIAVKLR